MAKQKKATMILFVVCIVLALLLGYSWWRMEETKAFYLRQHSGLANGIPFCMKVANAYVSGDTEQIVQLSRSENEAEFPNPEAYADLDLAFSGLSFPTSYLGGEGTYNCVIRYRLLSDVPSALADEIPPENIEHRDGKDYIYQSISVFYEYNKLEEENLGWSYVPGDFKGKPFSHAGDEAKLSVYENPK